MFCLNECKLGADYCVDLSEQSIPSRGEGDRARFEVKEAERAHIGPCVLAEGPRCLPG